MAKTLAKEITSVEVKNHELLKLAYDSYLANSRSAQASTLRRGEVRGGGKKPWRQKGTGRARFGSTRNPIWRHGGVAHGPIGEANFTKNISKVSKRIAIIQALSLKNADKAIVTVPVFNPEKAKTKEAIEFLNGNKLDIEKNKVLFVVNEKTDEKLRATNNLPNVKMIKANYLNVFDLLNADKIAIEESAIETINEWLGGPNA